MSTVCLKRSSAPAPLVPIYLPLFLLPAFATSPRPASAASPKTFSTTRCQAYQKRTREKNKQRGVSAIRRTGPRVPLSISKYPLPKPVFNSERRDAFAANPNHGLWGFFNSEKAPMVSPEIEGAHGRAWSYPELATKSFDQLHALYWVATKERNQISTREKERDRLKAGYGDAESEQRTHVVQNTMRLIRKVLLDRYYSWEEARVLLEKTTAVDLLEAQSDNNFVGDDGGTEEGLAVAELIKPRSQHVQEAAHINA